MLATLLGIRIFDVEVSSRCNLHCRFCPRDKIPSTGLMSEKTFGRFLDAVPLKSTDSLAFVGMGEPTLNPRLPDFIQQAKARYPKVVTWVTTNGTTLTKGMVERLAGAGLDILDVSFKGVDRATYEAQMRGACYQASLENVEGAARLIDGMGLRTKLQVNFVVTKENRSGVKAVKAFWRRRGVENFRIQRMHSRGGTVALKDMNGEGGRGLGGRGCVVFDTMTFVAWDGKVYYCSHDAGRRHPIGDIHTDSLQAIRARKRAIRRQGAWTEVCAGCTDPLRRDMRQEIDRAIVSELAAVPGRLCRAVRRGGGRRAGSATEVQVGLERRPWTEEGLG